MSGRGEGGGVVVAARAVLVGIIFLSPFPLLSVPSVAVQVLLTPWIISCVYYGGRGRKQQQQQSR